VDLEKGAAGRLKAAAATEEEGEELAVVDPRKALCIKATLVRLHLAFLPLFQLLLHLMLFVIEFHAYSLLKKN
jgi:hypothetical protein